MEQVLPRFESKPFLKAYDRLDQLEFLRQLLPYATPDERERRKVSIGSITKRLQAQIPADISERDKPEALNWLITIFIKGDRNLNFILVDDRSRWENKIRSLETFYQIKDQGLSHFLEIKDINQLEGIENLDWVVHEAIPKYEKHKEEKLDKDADLGTNLIYEDSDWQVYIPENKGAACKLGKGTDWCTAAPGLEYYKQYHKPDDPLIIFINKEDSNIKYQFHYGTKQFMDSQDRPIGRNMIFYKLNELLKNCSGKLPKSVNDVVSRYEYKSFGSGRWYMKYDGMQKWFENGALSRSEDEGPAIIDENGDETYMKNGLIHREHGPAKIFKDDNGEIESEQWFQHGKLHRLDGPAILLKDDPPIWAIAGERFENEQDWQAAKLAKKDTGLYESRRRFKVSII